MEYGFALVTPNGCSNGVNIKLLKDLILMGIELNITTLLYIYEFNQFDMDELYKNTDGIEFDKILKSDSEDKFIMSVFIKGDNANILLNELASKYNLNGNLNYVYVFKSAISDLCNCFGITDFEQVEEYINKNIGEVKSFDFKGQRQNSTKYLK